jgi:hypothetical protein
METAATIDQAADTEAVWQSGRQLESKRIDCAMKVDVAGSAIGRMPVRAAY